MIEMLPTIAEIEYHASANQRLSFFFSNGRLHIEKNQAGALYEA